MSSVAGSDFESDRGSVISSDDIGGTFSDTGFYYSSSSSRKHRASNASSLMNKLQRSNSTPVNSVCIQIGVFTNLSPVFTPSISNETP